MKKNHLSLRTLALLTAFILIFPVFAAYAEGETMPVESAIKVEAHNHEGCLECMDFDTLVTVKASRANPTRDVGSDSQVCAKHPSGPFAYLLGPDLPGRFDTVHQVLCMASGCSSSEYVPHSKSTSQYSATQHKIRCYKCGWYGLYNHTFQYTGGEIACTKCGYVRQ